MPTLYVTKEFLDTVRASGYDPQQYLNALIDREINVTRKLKPTLPAEVLVTIEKSTRSHSVSQN
jgi:hypothetical protein